MHNFARTIDTLDKIVEHDGQVLLPQAAGSGRAYLHGDNQYYGGPVFFGNRAEDHYGRIKGFEGSPNYKGGTYMGAAGVVNLSYIAAMRSDSAILFDINPHQKIFWDRFLKLLGEHGDKAEFLEAFEADQSALEEAIYSAIKGDTLRQRFSDSVLWKPSQRGQGALYNGWMPIVTPFNRKPLGELAWFDDDNHYVHVHEMAKAGQIGALTLDVCDEISVLRLVESLEGRTVSALYISNIMRFFDKNSDWSGRNFDSDAPSAQKAKRVMSNLLLEDSLIISDTRLETAFWSKQLFGDFVMEAHGNARKILSIC